LDAGCEDVSGPGRETGRYAARSPAKP
jgi:hypothetical protein